MGTRVLSLGIIDIRIARKCRQASGDVKEPNPESGLKPDP